MFAYRSVAARCLVAVAAATFMACATAEPPPRRTAEPFPDIVLEGSGAKPHANKASRDAARKAAGPGPGSGPEAAAEDRDYAQGGPEPQPLLRDRIVEAPEEGTPSLAPTPRKRRKKPPALLRRAPSGPAMKMHVLDVGQGSATLLEFDCGVVLVDTGGEKNDSYDGPAAVLRQLNAFFARRTDLSRTIDLLVITHPHIDHLRGAPGVLKNFKVRNIIDNGNEGEELVREPMDAIARYVAETGAGYRAILVPDIDPEQGLTSPVIDPLQCKKVDPKIRVLFGHLAQDPGWGIDFYQHSNFADENNHSIVLRVDFGKSAILITGDLEEVAIEALIERSADAGLLKADAYVVGHHGSHNGTTRELMREIDAQVAIISMGPSTREEDWSAWRYGHPRAGIVRMLANTVSQRRKAVSVPVAKFGRTFSPLLMESAVYGTGWDGAVTVELDTNRRLRVLTQRAPGRVSTR